MRFLFLGNLEMRDGDGHGIRLSSTRHRQLLALLLLRANHPISVTQLVDGIWPEDPPHSARANIKTYVSALRRHVGTADATIETVPRGYRLLVHRHAVDGLLFEEHVRAGERAGRRGDVAAEVDHLKQAIVLWRGEALQDLPSARGPLRDAATRWHEKRMSAIHDLTAALLAQGRNAEAIDHLRMAISDEPLRERLWVMLMLALYRDGRQAESLSAYLELRTMLVDTFGLEPCQELRDLHARILGGEDLGAPVAAPQRRPVGTDPVPDHVQRPPVAACRCAESVR